jgi:hypothetical protein
VLISSFKNKKTRKDNIVGAVIFEEYMVVAEVCIYLNYLFWLSFWIQRFYLCLFFFFFNKAIAKWTKP